MTNRSMFVKKEIPIRKSQVYAAKEVFEKVVKRGEKVERGFLMIICWEAPSFCESTV
jgi:hypothetical protein